MKELVLATQNPDKYREIKDILGDISGLSLNWAGAFSRIGEIEETGDTLEENAAIKASYVSGMLEKPAIADDTGLFVEYLKGRPGVRSARYAGENVSYEDNVKKLLRELKDVPRNKRSAEFKTAVCLAIPGGKKYFTEGALKGIITLEPRGTKGFGYDPVFFIPKKSKTFAQMSKQEKNSISHRYKAFKNVKDLIIREVA